MEGMNNPLSKAIGTITDRLRDKHGLEPHIGFEWEFQLLDNAGKPVPENVVKDLLKGDDRIGKIYEERGHGLLEITTKPHPALKAADTMAEIQGRVGTWAKENGYHLSAHPVVSRESNIHAISGSAGMHTNSSLNRVGRIMEDNRHNSILSIADRTWEVDALSANAANGIVEINSQTPLWSHQGEDDLLRLKHGDGTPKAYGIGMEKSGKPNAVEFRTNHPSPKTPEAMGHNPFNGAEIYAARLEERVANARIDPHVAAFRTVLGHYHGLETQYTKLMQYSTQSILIMVLFLKPWKEWRTNIWRKALSPINMSAICMMRKRYVILTKEAEIHSI
jgi:hypothetical protein